MKWSKEEDELLVELRQAGVPYKNKVKVWESKVERGVKGFQPRTQDALRNHMNLLRNHRRSEDEKQQIVGVYDIETSALLADFGYMLSWAVYYPYGSLKNPEPHTTHDVIKRTHILKYKEDYYLCKSLVKEMEGIDLLITYNGTRFDNDFGRTRCIMHGLPFPKYGDIAHRDVYYMIKGKLRTRRKTQEVAMETFGIEGKNHVEPAIWRKAKLGHKESLEYVLDHNIRDVEGLWELYQKIKPFTKYRQRSI